MPLLFPFKFLSFSKIWKLKLVMGRVRTRTRKEDSDLVFLQDSDSLLEKFVGLRVESNTKGLGLGLESTKVGLYPSQNLTDYYLTHDYFVATLQT